ncbi:MAG: hypothetical protein A2Y17_07670 [Clostridiales bacterium GWF2_38_85]|nr:MAG: hypothetical protein A2Y17_07670 [Clostridiales bacterium GWF2_38_85]HBL84247.1 AraC family transcriptional regulator [Clostridiales bacterium]
MKNFYILTDAINFIEDNLCEAVSGDSVADFCYVSLSSLQKLFRYALHCSIMEYISKRRLSKAAEELLKTNSKITEVAFRYQYNSPEVFCRSFKGFWGIAPSAYRRKRHFSNLFPKINFTYQKGDDLTMSRKKVDISESYEVLRNLGGTYVICFDIIGLTAINAISNDAGDLAIAEIVRRIDNVASDNMLMLRIGGDEFALVTELSDSTEAEKVASEVLQQNGNPIEYKEQRLPLSVRAGATMIPTQTLRYSELFMDMHNAIIECRNAGLEFKVIE